MSIDGQTIVKQISIHVPRVEDDADTRKQQTYRKHFNPRPPCGGRQLSCAAEFGEEFISIHVPRVEDDASSSIL